MVFHLHDTSLHYDAQILADFEFTGQDCHSDLSSQQLQLIHIYADRNRQIL